MNRPDGRRDDTPLGEQSDRSLRWRYPVAAFVVVSAAVGAVLVLGHVLLGWNLDRASVGYFTPPAGFFGSWYRADSFWYLSAAQDGYFYDASTPSNIVFWPGFPLLVRAVQLVVRDWAAAGVLASLASGCAAVVLYWSWLRTRLSDRTARLALWLFLLYPYSLYLYGPVYAESLVIAGAIGAFLLLERGHPALAGLAGAVAAAGRLVGIAIVFALAVRVLELSGVVGSERRGRGAGRRRVTPTDGLVLLASGGLVGFLVFNWVRFGDPLTPLAAQRTSPTWGADLSPSSILKVAFFHRLGDLPQPQWTLLLLHAVLAVVFAAFVPLVWRRFGPSYGVYAALVIGIPAVTSPTLYGMGRYVLLAFPVFAAAAELIERRFPAASRGVLVGSGTLLALVVGLYGSGYYVG